MGFFNDLREDLASAVNQLTDDKSENDIEISSKQMKDEIAKKEKKNKKDKRNNENLEHEIKNYLNISEESEEASKEENNSEDNSYNLEMNSDYGFENTSNEANAPIEENVFETVVEEEFVGSEESDNITEEAKDFMENTFISNDQTAYDAETSNDYSIISKGSIVHGGIDTTGSIEIHGIVEGSVKANGELILSGSITGNVEALIISVNAGKIRGNVKAYNGIYISEDSILIGDIESTEAEIGGAVKGKIDVNGPVVLKSDAKVLGDIDCKSVQINNGAVIEGKCSQKYADVSPSKFFENL